MAPDYFRTLYIGLLAGREFESRDDAAAMPVAIVNETLARRFWGGGRRPIGQRVRVASGDWRTVIGVARDVKYTRVNEEPRPVRVPAVPADLLDRMMLHARGSAGVAAPIERVRAHLRRSIPTCRSSMPGRSASRRGRR